jgi:hypothetical protein
VVDFLMLAIRGSAQRRQTPKLQSLTEIPIVSALNLR